tara:strand:- start:44 stop:514 length:471 start_codon:yes stop_codon:yes gene_type:complete
MAILDTAALLAWPIEKLSGEVVAISQLRELENVSSERAMLIESIDLNWVTPDSRNLQLAKDAANHSGDLTKLSDVDLDLIALCFQLDEELFTDDYRIQNTLTKAGKKWKHVIQKGITDVWVWMQVCTGCGKSKNSDEKQMSCEHCGSPLKLKKKKR